MAKWIVKAMAQGALSFVPKGELWKRYLQEKVIGSLRLDAREFEYKLGLAEKHFAKYLQAGGSRETFTVLELGTGYYPILPIGLWLCGAGHVRTIDKLPLASPARLEESLRFFVKYAEDGRLRRFLPHAREERIERLAGLEWEHRSPAEALRRAGVELLVGDARQTGLPDSSIDFFFSNVVLRDIPEEILSGIFREFRRVATPRAIMCHHVSLEDHYADYDPAISIYNFLRYSDAVWKLANCSLHYQNRLRISDYRRIHQGAGFHVTAEENQTDRRRLWTNCAWRRASIITVRKICWCREAG